MNRREFITASSFAAASAVSFGLSKGEVPSLNLSTLPAHPRLFANAARFVAVKAQDDLVSLQLRTLIYAETEKILASPDIIYPISGILFWEMREVQRRILFLAFSYRLTGAQHYFDRARKELLQLAALPSWNPSHFLDVGEAALAAGIGLDWLYHELSADDREQVQDAIVANALLPSLKAREGNNSWVDGDFNWNQVCNGSLIIAALAIAEHRPDLTNHIIERAIHNIPKASAIYAPDGSYPEGPSYWIYGTSFQILCVEALNSALGRTFGLDREPGFLESAEFKRQMVAPSGNDYNFSDYFDEHLEIPIMFWFARELNNRHIADNQIMKLNHMYEANNLGATTKLDRRFVASRHMMFGLLWWNPSLRSSNVTEPLHWTASGVLPIAAIRSAWGDPNAVYVAIKGGTPNHSHAHMDIGSFILEANGIRWAVDLGSEDYNNMRAANLTLWDYSQNSTRWNAFRVGPDAHNILRFDGMLQQVDGKAKISVLLDETGAAGNLVDLTSIYRAQVTHAQRRVQLYTDQSVSISDTWTSDDYVTKVSWQWLTTSTPTITSSGFVLKQAGKELRLQAISESKLAFSVDDVSHARSSFDSPNPGLKRLVIRLQTQPRSHGSLTVVASPMPQMNANEHS